MDDNTRLVLVTGLQVGLGVLGGVLASLVTFRLTRGLERERWAREDASKASDQLRAARSRWSDERRELYSRFLKDYYQLVDYGRAIFAGKRIPQEKWEPVWDRSYHAMLEISLMSPSVGASADALWDATTDLFQQAQAHTGTTAPALEKREARSNKALAAFMRAAQKDLSP